MVFHHTDLTKEVENRNASVSPSEFDKLLKLFCKIILFYQNKTKKVFLHIKKLPET